MNKGKCGVCGDPWNGPRPNEAGGKYARGIITDYYHKGQEIDVNIRLTTNHWGWFEFRICPNNNVSKPATHECLNKYLLQLADGSGSRYHLKTQRNGDFPIKLKLPEDLTCSQCVLQWKYRGGKAALYLIIYTLFSPYCLYILIIIDYSHSMWFFFH